jgi:hypothetical protein
VLAGFKLRLGTLIRKCSDCPARFTAKIIKCCAGIDLHHPRSSRAEVSAEGQASFRRRRAMTEQEIEDVAKAIYLLRVAPRRFPRKWEELTIEARRSFEKDAIAAIMALDALRLG